MHTRDSAYAYARDQSKPRGSLEYAEITALLGPTDSSHMVPQLDYDVAKFAQQGSDSERRSECLCQRGLISHMMSSHF